MFCCINSSADEFSCNCHEDNELDIASSLFEDALKLQKQGHLSDALEKYTKCLVLDPLNVEASFNLATVFHEKGRTAEAVKYYIYSIALNSLHFESWYNLGYIYYDMKEWGNSIKCFTRAVEINANDIDSWINLALAQQKVDLTLAKESYQHALQLNPRNISAIQNYGSFLIECESFSEAKLQFEKILDIEPMHKGAQDALMLISRNSKI